MVTKTCGIDWSEGQQDVAIVDEQARVLARTRVADMRITPSKLIMGG
jgi:hypothetical protein